MDNDRLTELMSLDTIPIPAGIEIEFEDFPDGLEHILWLGDSRLRLYNTRYTGGPGTFRQEQLPFNRRGELIHG